MSGEMSALCYTAVMFLRSLCVLAMPAEQQIDWLRSLGLGEPSVCDELADEYYQQWLMLPQLVGAGLIPAVAVDGLNRLNEILGSLISPGSKFGTVEALRTTTEWQDVRDVARSCVISLK